MVLSGLVTWRLLRPLPFAVRGILTVVAAIGTPVMLAVLLLTGMPLVVLAGLAAPVALVVVAVATGRRRERPAAI